MSNIACSKHHRHMQQPTGPTDAPVKTPAPRHRRLQNFHSLQRRLRLTPSPNSVPSGNTTAARPLDFNRRMMRTRRGRRSRACGSAAGNFDSMPSSSHPPYGGLVSTIHAIALRVHSTNTRPLRNRAPRRGTRSHIRTLVATSTEPGERYGRRMG